MLLRVTKRISLALGLVTMTFVAPTWAGELSQNQATADAVAASLRSVPGLDGAPVQIEARSGQVILKGLVSSPELKSIALVKTRQVDGVLAVVDRLQVTPDPRVQPVRYDLSGGATVGTPIDGTLNAPLAGTMGAPYAGGMVGDVGLGGTVTGPVYAGDAGNAPMAEGPAMPGASTMGTPAYPNYAWPSYAPYPNFSGVGYPTVYPWQAWPNIGPFYPYPEVPLDWRAVTLRWDDGLWWLDFKKHYTRPIFTPYPFGLKAY